MNTRRDTTAGVNAIKDNTTTDNASNAREDIFTNNSLEKIVLDKMFLKNAVLKKTVLKKTVWKKKILERFVNQIIVRQMVSRKIVFSRKATSKTIILLFRLILSFYL